GLASRARREPYPFPRTPVPTTPVILANRPHSVQHLEPPAGGAHLYNSSRFASRADDRCPAWPLVREGRPPGRGKSGLHRTRWWVTPTVRQRRQRRWKDRESATERIPPAQRSAISGQRSASKTKAFRLWLTAES